MSLRQRAAKAAADEMDALRRAKIKHEQQQREARVSRFREALQTVLGGETYPTLAFDSLGVPYYDEDGYRFYDDSDKFTARLRVHIICSTCQRVSDGYAALYGLSDLSQYAGATLCESCLAEASNAP